MIAHNRFVCLWAWRECVPPGLKRRVRVAYDIWRRDRRDLEKIRVLRRLQTEIQTILYYLAPKLRELDLGLQAQVESELDRPPSGLVFTETTKP